MTVYKNFHVSMGTKKMSDVMYATIITRSAITSTFGIGIYAFTRIQNSRNDIDGVLMIDDTKVEQWERLSGIKLIDPIIPKPN